MSTNASERLDSRFKGFPVAAQPCLVEQIGRRNWNLFDDDLPYPLAVLRQTELEHNLRWMQAFARERGLLIAPHGKTTMSPQLFGRQLALGAWGLTFATVFQARTGIEAGARRLIIANQVVHRADLDALAHLLRATDGLRVWFLVDSLAQVDLIETWARGQPSAVRFDCLLEIGVQGQRTGCRSFDQAMALARRIRQSGCLDLGGVECYEGGLAHGQGDHDRKEVGDLMARVDDVARECDRLDLFQYEQIIISAGGSAVFDLVVPGLKLALSRPVAGILRSGCYITHDHDFYSNMLRNVERREGLRASLQPALEIWTMVQSVPEPGLAILSGGKRDMSHDLSLPLAAHHVPAGARARQPVPAGWSIFALNDQHAYLRFQAGPVAPAVGDRVVLGISHPCTTFDKWAWLPIVDDAGTVVAAVTTRF